MAVKTKAKTKTRVTTNVASMFREDDKRSRLLNIDKQAWIHERLEDEYNQNPMLQPGDVVRIINAVNKSITLFNNAVKLNPKFDPKNSTQANPILDINEADTESYFIRPFISELTLQTKWKVLKEYTLFGQNAKLDAVIYHEDHVEKRDNDTNFVFMEHKKAGIWARNNPKSILEAAKAHGLIQRQDSKSNEIAYTLKGPAARQMVHYLDATKTISGGNTSAGIITNGLSYYFMVCNGNDTKAFNQTWSIVYCLDLIEIADAYNKGNLADIKNAEVKLNTFIGLIDAFLSNKKRKEFFKLYNNLYSQLEKRVARSCYNYSAADLDKAYEKYKNLINFYNKAGVPICKNSKFKKFVYSK